MRTHLVVIVGAGLITASGALLATAGQTAQKAAAASMVVYKSAT